MYPFLLNHVFESPPQSLSLDFVFLFLDALVSLKSPTVSPSHLDHEEWDHGDGNTGKQDECPLSSDGINDRLNSSDTSSTNQTSHQVVDSCCTGAGTGIKIDDEGAVDGEDGSRTIGNDELQNDGDCKVCSKRDTIECNTDDENRSDPPGVAHTGVFNGEVGMGFRVDAGVDGEVVLLAVFTFGSLVIVVHQVSNGVRASHTSETIAEKSQANLHRIETVLLFKQVGGRGCDHGPDSVHNATKEQSDEDVLLA